MCADSALGQETVFVTQQFVLQEFLLAVLCCVSSLSDVSYNPECVVHCEQIIIDLAISARFCHLTMTWCWIFYVVSSYYHLCILTAITLPIPFSVLFPASDDDEKEKQSATPKKHRPTGSREPQPSTSGFNTGRNKAPATSTRKKTVHDHSSDSESSAEESTARPSRPTTRQRKAQTRNGASAWGDRTNATDVLDFLDKSDVAAGREGKKSLGLKGKRNESRGEVSRGGTKTTSAQPPLEDSLVTPSFSSVSSVFGEC